jgi:hypothetical protein
MAAPEDEWLERLEIDDIPELAHPIGDPIKNEQMRQAGITFNAAMSIGVIGTVVLLAGILSLLFSTLQTDKGGLTLGAGIVMDVLSFFMIKFHRETNNRLDEIRRDENAMKLVGQITDPAARNQAIAELVRAFRRLTP